MLYSDLISELMGRTGYTRRETRKLLEHLTDIIGTELRQGRDVVWPGLGRFENVPLRGWTIKNPHTGEPVVIPPRRRVHFKIDKKLKIRVRWSKEYFKEDDPITKYLPESVKHGKVRRRDRP